MDGKALVEQARAAALRHAMTWGELVPSSFIVNRDAEPAEEAAYAEMVEARRALSDHIRDTYGLSIGELASLARP